MKYLILILIFVACSNTENNRQSEMIHHVDSIVKNFNRIDTISETYILKDTIIETDTIRKAIFINESDSLIWHKYYILGKYTIIQKLYSSSKHNGIPYWLVTQANNTITRQCYMNNVYCSQCKLMVSEAKYYQLAEKWIEEN